AATLATLPIGLFQLPSQMTGWKVTASVLTLGIAGTGLAYILYYALISGAGASRAILITYLVPTFAVVYGALLLGEPVTVAALGGLSLVLAGVGLGTGAVRLELANRRSRIANLGNLAIHPDFRGRHLSDEAAKLLQRHLLFDLGLHRLQLEIYGFNERAQRHAERAGFIREGARRRAY